MTVRLPTPGGDDGDWGDILNTFLLVAHSSSGTLLQESLITGAEQTTNKGVANGYAGLGSGGVVPDSQLAVPLSTVGDYIGLEAASQSIATDVEITVSWDEMLTSRGSSLTWSDSDPATLSITSAGVYAISVTVDWGDWNDSSGSSRLVQLYATCEFTTSNRCPSVIDDFDTVQSIEFTAYFQPGDDLQIWLSHVSSLTLTPDTRILVTRLG